MKENDVVLRMVMKFVVFILLIFGFYVFFVGYNNFGGGFIGGLIFSLVFILMFLVFNVEEVLESLLIDFRILMIIGVLVLFIIVIIFMFFGKLFLF